MHIVFVTTELAAVNNAAGGLASFTSNMAHIFKENGHKISIILPSTKEIRILPEVEEGIDLYSFYVPMKIWKKMDIVSKFLSYILKKDRDELRRGIMLKYKLKKTKDIIHHIHKENPIDIIHSSNHTLIYGKWTKKFPYIIRISALKNIWREANMPESQIQYEYVNNPRTTIDKLEDTNIRKARYVVAPSYLYADIITRDMGITVNVIESPFVLEKQGWDEYYLNQYNLKERKYIIHYGRLRYFKGTYVVAKLAKELLQNQPDLYLVLAGGYEDMQDEEGNVMAAPELVKQEAGDYADRVLYVGRLVREQLYPLIRHAEVCLLPSRIENLSNACIEAMAMGKIVVATDGASYEQLIDNGINGFLCEKDNPESFLQGIEAALSLNDEEKRFMECKAAETTERLSPDNIYKQYLDFYENVIKGW